jgi:hypothetical protein
MKTAILVGIIGGVQALLLLAFYMQYQERKQLLSLYHQKDMEQLRQIAVTCGTNIESFEVYNIGSYKVNCGSNLK